jgi:formylmethanofuran dehydrogenase subunit B
MAWPHSRNEWPDCSRLRHWLSGADAARMEQSLPGMVERRSARLAEHAQRLAAARSPLLWIESADVSATRAAVALAELCNATVHVAQSPGADNVAAVTSACGNLGTSLAEVAGHADLIVHIGHRHLTELPRLAPRFLRGRAEASPGDARRHVLVGDAPLEAWTGPLELSPSDRPLVLRWPRAVWLDGLTRVLMAARGDSAPSNRPSDAADAPATELAELLAASRYAVFLWDEDEFADQLDRLMVERLLEIADVISRTTRCSLLPLGADPGRTTSKETLLWLTNVAGTARYVDGAWTGSRTGASAALADWQNEHDWILCLRNLPSDRPLPDLAFDLVLDASCNRSAAPTQSSGERDGDRRMPVAGVGWDWPGHLIRIDHAFGAYVHSVTPEASKRQFSAEFTLREVARNLLLARTA